MKRNMDLIEVALLVVEGSPMAAINPGDEATMLAFAEYDQPFTKEVLGYHLWLLVDAGFLKVDDAGLAGLTWVGHDYLDHIRGSRPAPTTYKTLCC